jgi:hypothetical protein
MQTYFRPPRAGVATGLVMMAVIAGVPATGGASILTFDQARDAATATIVVPISAGAAVPQDYGDRVTGSPMAVPGGFFTYGVGAEGFTPNVLTDYLSPGHVSLWPTGFGDLVNAAYGSQGSGLYEVVLTADPGFSVELYGFDLGGWPHLDYTIDGVTVSDGVTTLFSLPNAFIEGNRTGPPHTAFSFAPLSGQQLRILVDYGNLPRNMQDNIGIDNVRFGQTPPPAAGPSAIPEPAVWHLFGIAAAGLLRRGARPRRG